MKSKAAKLFFLVFIISSFPILINAQVKDSILYVLSDEVEMSAFEYMNKIDKVGNFKFDAILKKRTVDDNYALCISYMEVDREYYYYAKTTNRFLVVGDRRIPLFFDYDELFATSDNNDIGVFKSREGYVRRQSILFDYCFTIVFDRKGKIVEK
jgi:hypothetical protein